MVSYSVVTVFGTVYVMHLRLAAVQRGALPVLAVLRESEWGLGQIIAPFTWAPLIIDLATCVVNAVGKTPLPERGCFPGCKVCDGTGTALPVREQPEQEAAG